MYMLHPNVKWDGLGHSSFIIISHLPLDQPFDILVMTNADVYIEDPSLWTRSCHITFEKSRSLCITIPFMAIKMEPHHHHHRIVSTAQAMYRGRSESLCVGVTFKLDEAVFLEKVERLYSDATK